MSERHNRWTPDCQHYRPPAGPYTQYLVDWHRGESCSACTAESQTHTQ